MTIASAFNDIAVAQGGTAAKSGAITAAIDALNDALAGSDQPQAKTIEQAVRLLGEHIGGGGGGTEYSIACYGVDESQQLVPEQDCFSLGKWDSANHAWTADGGIVTKAEPGDVVYLSDSSRGSLSVLLSEPSQNGIMYPIDTRFTGTFVMPAHDVCAVLAK